MKDKLEKISVVEQTPNRENSITNNKPEQPHSKNLLQGFIANSWNGGFIKPIAFKKIMAGEKIENLNLSGVMRMLTPKAPPIQGLKTVFKVFFVPNIRVWNNAEKYMAQKGGSTKTKITEVPNTDGHYVTMAKREETKFIPVTDTTIWRDSWVSSYIPRIYARQENNELNNILIKMPKMSILPIRGFKAIYNDFLRNKAIENGFIEYKDDTVSDIEWKTIMPDPSLWFGGTAKNFMCRGRKQDSYYTDWRTELEGVDNTISPMYTDLQQHTEWQKLIAESRSQVENEQLNDWEIVAKIRGSKPVTQGKVQFLAMKEITMNYSQVAQTTYNANANIQAEFQNLGQTGAFSYTEFSTDLLQYHTFQEEGYLHIIAQTTADTIFETGVDRTLLNCRYDEEYRPDLINLKDDVLYQAEYTTHAFMNYKNIVGYKRKFSELFKAPNVLNGDMTNSQIYEFDESKNTWSEPIPMKDYYQYFENSAVPIKTNEIYTYDFTDYMINKNQAIENERTIAGPADNQVNYYKGPNQIFMVAETNYIDDLPIDESIKKNYKKWGEV